LPFTQGQRVLVAIDGKSGTSGMAVLNVLPVTCPETDVSGQSFPVSFTTVGGANAHTGACGGDALSERSYRFIPPADGLYRFSVDSTTIQPALYLERGAKCGGEMLGCNATPGAGNPATVTRWLPGGAPVTIIVDSNAGTGTFELDVEALGVACPATTPAWGTTMTIDSSAPEILSGTCQPASSPLFGGPTREHSFPYSVDITTVGMVCGIRILSATPLMAYVLRGSQCDGPEKTGSCQISTCTTSCTLTLPFGLVDSGQYVVVVENISNYGSDVTYTLQQYCVL
jgi:hypothetical protein